MELKDIKQFRMHSADAYLGLAIAYLEIDPRRSHIRHAWRSGKKPEP